MKKGLKTITSILSAAVLACGAMSLAACGYTFTPPEGGPDASAATASNGGFVVEKGEYFYFINGVETYTSDNTYGTPEKGALMRIKKADADAGNNTAELIIPSLMVSGNTTGTGIFIYGDRIYYATPNNMKNTSGEVENTYLDFKSAKLDGTDIRSYFYVDDNSVEYRFVEAGEGENKAVYLLYAGKDDDGQSAILSYNTATGTRTSLVSGYLSYAFNKTDKEDPWVYYTMSVTDNADSDGALAAGYQQLYRVRADVTAAPYPYTWDQAWLDENNEGKEPYHNLGEIVLDGKGTLAGENTQFNHSDAEPQTPTGYTYPVLRAYANGGVYFTRSGGLYDGYLLYLSADKLTADWDSIAGNEQVEIVANATDIGSKATDSALFFRENGEHRYFYLADGDIHYVKVGADGAIASDLAIAFNVSGATFKFIDNTSDENYKYVYFGKSNGSGTSVERAVYNGDELDYKNGKFEDRDSEPFKSVQVLGLQHASWYDYEVVDGTLFYADAETVGSVSYNYVSCVNLKNADGKLMNNKELAAFNAKYEEIMGDKGLVKTLSSESNAKLSALISYYFKSGESKAMQENIDESIANGKAETYLFSEAEKAAFLAFAANKGDESEAALFGADDYKDEAGVYYRTISYFVHKIGKVTEADAEAMDLAWRNTIQRDAVEETEEESGLAAWEIALIAVAAVLFAAGVAGVTVFLVLRKKKKAGGGTEARMNVKTDVDRDIDVYTPEEPAEPIAEPVESAEPAETPDETAKTSIEPPADAAKPTEPADIAEPTEPTEPTAEPTEIPADPAADTH